MKNKCPCPTEFQEAKMFWQWSSYHPIAKNHLFAVPNGGSRNVLEASNLKKTGVRAGVSDYFFAYPHNGKSGLFIELKRSDKKVSKLTAQQSLWLETCERVGYSVKVAYGADDAIRSINEYLST